MTGAQEWSTTADGGAMLLLHLDEPEDATEVADSSGSALVGTVTASVVLGVPGRFSTGAEFDGSSGSEIIVADAPGLEVTDNPFTLEAQIRFDATAVGSDAAIASKWYASGEMAYLLLVNTDGKLEGRLWDSGSSAAVVVISNDALPTDEWVHVAMERSSTDELALYVDGVKQTDTADASFTVTETVESFRVGTTASDMHFVGTIDEVRLSVMTATTPARGESGDLGRVQVDYDYNERNQLVTETNGTSVKTYLYDNNGNTTDIVETIDTAEVSRETMVYDKLNRMTSHTGPKGTESFTYRGAEWHRYTAAGNTFLYDGDNVLADIAGGVTSNFYVTPFLDQNLSMTNAAGTYYYTQDGLGSVRTLTDEMGAIANAYDYLPFGGVHQPGTNVTVEQRYTYTGREKNPESALMYYRYRQYDPRMGRFGGRDPELERGSPDANIYGYVGARPVWLGDPMGLWFLVDHTIITVYACNREGICGVNCCMRLMKANKYVDNPGPKIFWGWASGRGGTYAKHYAKRSGVDPEKAKNAAEGWIDHWTERGDAYAAEGKCKKALAYYGYALHTIQDRYGHGVRDEAGNYTPGGGSLAEYDWWRREVHSPDKKKREHGEEGERRFAEAVDASAAYLAKAKVKLGCCCHFPRSPKQPKNTKCLCSPRGHDGH